MAKSRKEVAAAEQPPTPQVGDKVTVGTDSIYEIAKVHHGGEEVDLQFPGTNLMRFRVPVAKLTYVERKTPAKTSNPFTSPEPAYDAGEVLERIRAVEQENVQRLEDDIAILTKYLKTQDAPKPVIEALEGLSSQQKKSWKTAIEKVEELLEE
jgi:hypothetical protein